MMPRALAPSLVAALICAAVPVLAQDTPLAAGVDGVPTPKKTRHVQPQYPAEARARGIRGIVILELVIDPRGRVVDTSVVRGIPGLDEAAVAAARQWEYEPVKVDGKAVSVRLTQAITFAMELPRLARDPGVPELRQGVPPAFPAGANGGGRAAAEVSLEVDGRIGSARIVDGAEPWAGALLAALETWRFSPPPEDATVSFKVHADFVPAKGSAPPRVLLQAGEAERADLLTPLPAAPASTATAPGATTRTAAAAGAPPSAPAATDVPPSTPAPQSPADAAPSASASAPPPPTTPPVAAAPTPARAAGTSAPATGAQTTPGQDAGRDEGERHPATPPPGAPAAPGSVPDTAPPPPTPGVSPTPIGPEGTGTPQRPEPVQPAPGAPQPAGPQVQPGGAPGAGRPAANVPPAPPVEVITAPPPELPPENGISAVRDVTLEPGVPDLTSGRRPVPPPLARMAGATGTVEVLFSVSAAGAPMLQGAKGPDLLRKAAEGIVGSWVFRRTRADRAYLLAVLTFADDKATAVVRPQPAPPDAGAVPAVLALPATSAPATDPGAALPAGKP